MGSQVGISSYGRPSFHLSTMTRCCAWQKSPLTLTNAINVQPGKRTGLVANRTLDPKGITTSKCSESKHVTNDLNEHWMQPTAEERPHSNAVNIALANGLSPQTIGLPEHSNTVKLFYNKRENISLIYLEQVYANTHLLSISEQK